MIEFLGHTPKYLFSGLQVRVRNEKLFSLFLNQNICCEYSKEPSHWDGFFEHPKHMFELMDKIIIVFFSLKGDGNPEDNYNLYERS